MHLSAMAGRGTKQDSESDESQVAPAVSIDLTKLYEMGSNSLLSPKQEFSEPKVHLSLQNFSEPPLCQPASNVYFLLEH